tara:strand:+ start:100 stop:687 length:588 start_codon:yes stop_codon:yes gene_type:complete
MGGGPDSDKPVIRPVSVEGKEALIPVPDPLPWLHRIREIVDSSEAPFLDGLSRWLTVNWSPPNSDLLGVTRFELEPNELMRRRRMKAPSGPVEIELHPILVDDQELLEHTFVHELLHAAGLTTHNLRHSELTEMLAPAPSLSDSPVLQRLRSAVIDGQHIQQWKCNGCSFQWKRSTVSRPKRCPKCAKSEVVPYE